MSEQEKNEILKSVVYGETTEEICEIYNITADELRNLVESSNEKIEKIKAHYKEMEG